MNPLLHVHDLAVSYGPLPVFAHVNFSLAPGGRLAVLGASGSGKSTLLRLLAGLQHPTAGRVERAPGLRLGMVFQDLALWPNLTARDNVALALPDLPRRQRRRTALDALASCRVAELASRKPASLSIGQQQRVALARALAVRPGLLLLDEPFSSLDPLLKAQLLAEVQTLGAEFDIALILVTHELAEALTLCQHALVIEDGTVKEAGNLRSLLAAPQSNFLTTSIRQLGALAALSSRPL